ncbi:MAG: M81 family metallopeptidase [Chitinophagaceae bacterium]
MYKTLVGFFLLSFLANGSLVIAQKIVKPRIAIVGLAIESSTYSPARSDEASFRAQYGKNVLATYPFMRPDSGIVAQADWFPALTGHAIPGGMVKRSAYETLVNRALDSLKAHLPYDGIFFDIHGAMSVEDLDDPEGDFITRIRNVVGKDVLISTSMDLHGNVSYQLAHQSDLTTCYRMAPHEDAMDTKKRAVVKLLERLKSGLGKPKYKAYVPVPVLLPGEKTSTRVEPGKSLYAKVYPAEKRGGVIDAAIWIGYAWADEVRNHAAVLVTGDNKDSVLETAAELAKAFWDVRPQFAFVAPVASLQEALNAALNSNKKPFFISDTGDNPTAGGAGDVTWTLDKLLQRPEFKTGNGPTVIYASVFDSAFVAKAAASHVGDSVSGFVGAHIDNVHQGPVYLKGKIFSVTQGDKDARVEVVVKVGTLYVIVPMKRKPYHKKGDYTRLGLDPEHADIVINKIGYLEPELYAMQKDWIMALTPGGVDQDLLRLPHNKIVRPMFPYDADMADPILTPVLIPSSSR